VEMIIKELCYRDNTQLIELMHAVVDSGPMSRSTMLPRSCRSCRNAKDGSAKLTYICNLIQCVRTSTVKYHLFEW
jgi:hypothetical protein